MTHMTVRDMLASPPGGTHAELLELCEQHGVGKVISHTCVISVFLTKACDTLHSLPVFADR